MTEQLELTGDLGDGLRLRKPLACRLKSGKDYFGPYWIAEETVFWNDGLAETQQEALLELRESLAELYRRGKAGRVASGFWLQLREYIEEVP